MVDEDIARANTGCPAGAGRALAIIFLILVTAIGVSTGRVSAQEQDPPAFSPEQFEQLVAPIALHPDALLSQILMASTYPLEVVQAARWSEQNPNVTGDALEKAMQDQPWDESVRSLTAFPQVLQMMNADLSWTQQLGDAFLAQQEDVLDAVQRLRARADEAGNLASTKEQKVERQTVTSDAGKKETMIVIEQADPKIIYVPAYNPTVIYGGWPYPAYPPYYWYPPGYVARRAFWFATGIIVGRALWGRCDWRRRSVNININVYNSFNKTKITSNRWQHKVEHRHGVPYRDRKVAGHYRPGTLDIRSREEFRGRAEAGRRDLPKVARPAPGQLPGHIQRPSPGRLPGNVQRPGQLPGNVQRPAIGKPPAVGQRPAMPGPSQRPAATPRPTVASRPSPAKQPVAIQGIGQGKQVRKQSNRGKQSREVSLSAPRLQPTGGRRGGGRRG